jgi:2,3-dihydroxybenzoate-AMP ligase
MTAEVQQLFAPQDGTRYRAAGLWGALPIAAELAVSVERYGDRVALVTAHGSLTYAELDRRTDLVAAGMLRLGLEPGDRILFQVTNRLETVVAWYACLKAALVPVATLAAHREHEIGRVSRQCGARAHLVEAGLGFDLVSFARGIAHAHPTLRQLLTIGSARGAAGTVALETLGGDLDREVARSAVAAAQAGVGPDDLAVLQLSGGTTGTPKLIPRQHAEYWYNAAAYARRLGWTAETRLAHLIPVVHNAGITCAVHAAHSCGATLVLGTPDMEASLPLMAEAGVDTVLIGHGHFSALAAPGFLDRLPTLRQVVLSGAKVPDALFAELERRGIWAGQLFGMGEGLFCLSRPEDPRSARLRTVGTALSELDEIRILEPGTEREVPHGEIGELCCRGPYTIRGYYAAPEHDANFTSDGFYRTGDLARWGTYDGQSHLLIEGRIKDVINRGGEKINAGEVERLLLGHPGIVQVAIVPMPDERLGERTCAYLVASQTLAMPDLQVFLESQGVAKYKWPERVVLVDDLPRTNVGKIDKQKLRRAAAVAASAGTGG